jgi:sec-independent protein translocase protein TatB
MFDFGIGYTEMVVVAIVAIIVIGPKDLPSVLRALGQTIKKMRGMASEFQGHLDQAMKEAGLEDVKKEVQNIKSTVSAATNPVGTIAKSVVSETKKNEDDFKKYFGEPAKTAKETPKPEAADAKA